MSHYICKGGECKTISDKATVCLEASCANRYKLLEECNCPHSKNHTLRVAASPGGFTSEISPVNFGLALGIVGSLCVFVLGIFSTISGFGKELVELLSGIYLGYDATVIGSIAGALWAFIDGVAGGVIFAWIYNRLQRFR